ncbi:MAG: N-acetylmuramoyl-L-alanine amidase, partial [Kyrpidia sp.]|nr:N-acetylmuramoyl-L-alanine amidase [Kyrpidia sp.]
MAQRVISLAAVGFLTAVIASVSAGVVPPPAARAQAAGPVSRGMSSGILGPVVIDPGHGGIDGGTSYGAILEKDLVLDIGLQLRDHLQRDGWTVVMTRERDEDVSSRYPSTLSSRHARDLRNRVRVAREAGARLYVSIHVNHSSSPVRRGAVILYAADDPDGAWLARIAQGQLAAAAGRAWTFPNRSLHVLRRSPCPAVLVEVGFLSNASDRAALLHPEYRRQLAEAL